jgi:serine phosphatase RsbU (regulator of sigma subunit)
VNPEIEPSKLLTAINKTVSRNIKLMGEDKYMTMTVLAALKDGKFQFSGLHQDILVYRAETGKVEEVETNGMWIGILDDIDGMLADNQLQINPGDTFLLYTDGITEAKKNGSAEAKDDPGDIEDMFGDDKLVDLFGELASGTTEEIRDGILKSLEGYTCPDDVTMVVVKRI